MNPKDLALTVVQEYPALSNTAQAGLIGISPSTLARWKLRGESNDVTENRNVDDTRFYRNLYLADIESKAVLESELVNSIVSVGKRGVWQASAWMLERLNPEQYNPRVETVVQKRLNAVLDKLADVMPETDYDNLIGYLEHVVGLEEGETTEKPDAPAITVDVIAS